jgi:DNA-directed RNA polymerase subunit K/omega
MTYKRSDAPDSTITRNSGELGDKVGNLYESLAIISKRADQIGRDIKEELNGKLSEFASSSDNLEEIFENREQIEISKYYEKLPKPLALAMVEFENDQIYYRNPANEEAETETE